MSEATLTESIPGLFTFTIKHRCDNGYWVMLEKQLTPDEANELDRIMNLPPVEYEK